MSIDEADYRTICPAIQRPDDFFEFWQQTLAELAEVPLDARLIDTVQHGDGLVERWFQFPSFNHVEVTAYCLGWDDDTPRPTVVYTHGYLGQCEVMLDWARAGLNIIGVDLRGMGRSKQASLPTAKRGYILTGIEQAKTSILRGTVCDYIRASELDALLGLHSSRLIFQGHSFGGAHALVATALTDRPALLVSGVPTLGWSEGRRRLVKRGSGHELNLYLKHNPELEPGIMQVLRYFDTMHFADQVRCPALIGLGQRDEVVPVETVYAITNHLSCPHEIREMPVSHSDAPEAVLWQQFETEWLQLARDGVPEGFGQRQQNLKLIA